MGGAPRLVGVAGSLGVSPSRLMKNGVCRGAKPLCRESEGVPQVQILALKWESPERAALSGGGLGVPPRIPIEGGRVGKSTQGRGPSAESLRARPELQIDKHRTLVLHLLLRDRPYAGCALFFV